MCLDELRLGQLLALYSPPFIVNQLTQRTKHDIIRGCHIAKIEGNKSLSILALVTVNGSPETPFT